MKRDAPSDINGVSVDKYRVTVERVEEPTEVLAARVQDLWDHCDNHHRWQGLKTRAAALGYALAGLPGNKREKRR